MALASEVCAVIYGDPIGPLLAELVQAVTEQSAQPAVILVEGQLAPGVAAAEARGTRWIWLVDGQTVPGTNALEELLSAVEALASPTPVLMAGNVLDEHGRLHTDAMPRHEIFEKERSVDAAERHLVQLRTAAHGSLLVSAAAVQRFGSPRSDLPSGLDMLEWSARMLRRWEDTGYLVPASMSVRRAPPVRQSWGHWLGRARVLGSPAWTPTERLWEAFLLGEAIAGAIRGPKVSRTCGRGGTGPQPIAQPPENYGEHAERKAIETQIGDDAHDQAEQQ